MAFVAKLNITFIPSVYYMNWYSGSLHPFTPCPFSLLQITCFVAAISIEDASDSVICCFLSFFLFLLECHLLCKLHLQEQFLLNKWQTPNLIV